MLRLQKVLAHEITILIILFCSVLTLPLWYIFIGDRVNQTTEYLQLVRYLILYTPQTANDFAKRCDARLENAQREDFSARYEKKLRVITDQTLQYQQAISDCNQAIQLDPQLPASYTFRGNAKGALKDYEGAIADFQKAETLFRAQGKEAEALGLRRIIVTYKSYH